jgi:haloalkane dehalogenase
VVPTPESREGIAVFPIEIMRSHPWLAELETRVAVVLADKPVVLLFGRKDPALGSDAIIDRWRAHFPHATSIDLPEAGHYIQEDAPDDIVRAIREAFG